MSDELDVNSRDSEGGFRTYLNFGGIGYIIFICCWLIGAVTYWNGYGFVKAISAIFVFTIIYLICAGICGVIGNAIRLYTMPDAFFTDGSITSVLKTKLFWAFVPQAIGIIIGLFLSEGLTGMVGFSPSRNQPATAITQQQSLKEKSIIDNKSKMAKQNTSTPSSNSDIVSAPVAPQTAVPSTTTEITNKPIESQNINDLQTLKEAYGKADKQINTAYKDVMSKLSPGVKAELKREEIAWVKEKENKCNAENDELKRLNCMLQMTNERTTQLNSYPIN